MASGGLQPGYLDLHHYGPKSSSPKPYNFRQRMFEKTICMKPAFTEFVPQKELVLPKHDLRASNVQVHRRSRGKIHHQMILLWIFILFT